MVLFYIRKRRISIYPLEISIFNLFGWVMLAWLLHYDLKKL